MKIYYLFLLTIASFFSYSQVIKGKVIDEAKQPIPYANIYFDGTSIATISDEKGKFELRIIAKTNATLLISYIGYQTVSISDYDYSKELIVILKESVNELKEVVIKKDPFTRKQKLKLFRTEFLGNTKAGRKAKILNEDDLDFEYDEVAKVFRASSDKPLLIENPVLGYEVTYEISDFIVTFNTLSIDAKDVNKVLITGVSRFKEIDASEKVIKQREKSFLGSTLHFFRSLVANKMLENKFNLLKDKKVTSVTDNFRISDSAGIKRVIVKRGTSFKLKDQPDKFISGYNILYNSTDNSYVKFLTPIFYVDEFGINTNFNQINFAGEMAINRIADLLPTNYGIDEK
jgi:hypothetical protein